MCGQRGQAIPLALKVGHVMFEPVYVRVDLREVRQRVAALVPAVMGLGFAGAIVAARAARGVDIGDVPKWDWDGWCSERKVSQARAEERACGWNARAREAERTRSRAWATSVSEASRRTAVVSIMDEAAAPPQGKRAMPDVHFGVEGLDVLLEGPVSSSTPSAASLRPSLRRSRRASSSAERRKSGDDSSATVEIFPPSLFQLELAAQRQQRLNIRLVDFALGSHRTQRHETVPRPCKMQRGAVQHAPVNCFKERHDGIAQPGALPLGRAHGGQRNTSRVLLTVSGGMRSVQRSVGTQRIQDCAQPRIEGLVSRASFIRVQLTDFVREIRAGRAQSKLRGQNASAARTPLDAS